MRKWIWTSALLALGAPACAGEGATSTDPREDDFGIPRLDAEAELERVVLYDRAVPQVLAVAHRAVMALFGEDGGYGFTLSAATADRIVSTTEGCAEVAYRAGFEAFVTFNAPCRVGEGGPEIAGALSATLIDGVLRVTFTTAIVDGTPLRGDMTLTPMMPPADHAARVAGFAAWVVSPGVGEISFHGESTLDAGATIEPRLNGFGEVVPQSPPAITDAHGWSCVAGPGQFELSHFTERACGSATGGIAVERVHACQKFYAIDRDYRQSEARSVVHLDVAGDSAEVSFFGYHGDLLRTYADDVVDELCAD